MATRLEVGKVALGAFLVPWWNRHAFARALAIPLVLWVMLSLAWYYAREYLPTLSNWLLYLLYGVLFVLFAVTCHRLVLLDPSIIAANLRPHWSWRETRFFLWMITVWLIFAGTLFVLSTLIMNVGLWTGRSDDSWFSWYLFAAQLPALYIFARFCLVFPATAVDRRVNLKWAWRLTESNGWRLVLIVTVLPWVLSRLVGLLYRENASVIETIVLTFVGYGLFAVEVAALSLSYRELVREEGSHLA